MIRRPPRSTQSRSSAASDVYKRQVQRDCPRPHDDCPQLPRRGLRPCPAPARCDIRHRRHVPQGGSQRRRHRGRHRAGGRGAARRGRRAQLPQPRRRGGVRRRQHHHRNAGPGGRRSARRAGPCRCTRRRRPGTRRDRRHVAGVARRLGQLRATAVSSVHVVVPEGVDDPARPSGGNTYDRRICDGLTGLGWAVHEHAVPGSWPRPDTAARADLGTVLAGISDGAVVLLDGLVASSVPDVLLPEAHRLRLVVLVHMPLGDRAGTTHHQECAVLSAAVAVITTSSWTLRWVLDRYGLRTCRVHVAEPGVDTADLAPETLSLGTGAGGELLSVAAVTPEKGHDVLLAALATLTNPSWRLVCVGTLARDPGFVDRLGRQAQEGGIGDRVRFAGPLTGADVAGLPEALGYGADGTRPGLLVPSGDPRSFAEAVRGWLDDPDLRRRLRQAAQERRVELPGWPETSARVSRVLTEVAG